MQEQSTNDCPSFGCLGNMVDHMTCLASEDPLLADRLLSRVNRRLLGDTSYSGFSNTDDQIQDVMDLFCTYMLHMKRKPLSFSNKSSSEPLVPCGLYSYTHTD